MLFRRVQGLLFDVPTQWVGQQGDRVPAQLRGGSIRQEESSRDAHQLHVLLPLPELGPTGLCHKSRGTLVLKLGFRYVQKRERRLIPNSRDEFL